MKYALLSIITVLCHVPSIVGSYQDETRNIMPEMPYSATNSTITQPITIISDPPDEQESLVTIDSDSAQQPVSGNDVDEHSSPTDSDENAQSVTTEEDTAADTLNQALDVRIPYTLFRGFKMLNFGVEDNSQQSSEGLAECTPVPNGNNANQGLNAVGTRPETDLDDHGTGSHNMIEQRYVGSYMYCIDARSSEEITEHPDLSSSAESSELNDTADVPPSRPSFKTWKLNLNGHFEAPDFETQQKVLDLSFSDQTSPTLKCKEPSEKNKLLTCRDAYNPQANDQFCSYSITDFIQVESADSDEDTGALSPKSGEQNSESVGALSESPTASTNTTVCTNSSLVKRVAAINTKLAGLRKLICSNHKHLTVSDYTRLLNYQLSMCDCVKLMMKRFKTNTQSILHHEAAVNSCEKLLKNIENLVESSVAISDPAKAADLEEQFLLLDAEHSALKRSLKNQEFCIG